MAIGAQQLKVTGISGPVFESARPNVLSFCRPYLFRRIDMVYVQSAVIVKSAARTFAAELFNQQELSLPITRTLMNSVSMFIPEIAHAQRRAKAVFAFFPACFALTLLPPSVREIARHSAKLSAFVFRDWFITVYASIHGFIITKYIACRRIEDAYRQRPLFEAEPKPVQCGLELDT